MIKFLSFFGLCMYVLATIGGFGYCCYCHAYVIAVSILALSAMALPTVKMFIEDLKD